MSPTAQPYTYQRTRREEPDWRRFAPWRDVTSHEWADPQWQRAHCVKNVAQLAQVLEGLVSEATLEEVRRDQERLATMSLLIPPQMLNTVAAHGVDDGSFRADPVRRYMLPMESDRRTDWPSHPMASRDSLHEQDMWVVEGLTHRYPTKVLAELLTTCPQYCGHCTRMDLVGNSTPSVTKLRLAGRPGERYEKILDYLRRTPQVRDVVVSGGDVANLPWPRLEQFVGALLEIESVRDVRLASKALVGLPQHWLQDDVRRGVERLAATARGRGVRLAIHTHANHVASVTPLVARASAAMLAAGVHEVRNQGVLLAGVNDSVEDLLDLSFALLDDALITPYYFYMCDMVPVSEHWRVSLAHAQHLQHGLMGYLPGFATPRIVCDVPFVGKRWVHQVDHYDRVRGISTWTKNYRTVLDEPDGSLAGEYVYYDPIHTLSEEGQRYWADR